MRRANWGLVANCTSWGTPTWAASLRVCRPVLRQIQRAIREGAALGRGRQKEDAHLTVFDVSGDPAVLRPNANRVVALFEKARFITDQIGLWIGEVAADIGLQIITHCISIPQRAPQEVLQGRGRLVSPMGGDGPPILALHRT